MSTHKKKQNCEIKRFWEPKGQTVGEAQGFYCFCINGGNLKKRRRFFPGKTCDLLFVRGTTSFYNKKLKIFPVGEGAVWNVRI